MQHHRPARRTGRHRLAHHRDEGRDAGPGRDVQVRPRVLGLEHELALGPDHPHRVAHRQPPEQRGEALDRDQPHVELVALAGDARGGGDRVGALHELAVGDDADGHVLPGLEGDRIAVVADPEEGEVIGLVDAAHERGVVLLRLGRDDAGVFVSGGSRPQCTVGRRLQSHPPGSPAPHTRRPMDERYYLTTAIFYPSPAPPLHSLFEAIGADAIARYQRLLGKETVFQTGMDEHSAQVEKLAADRGRRAAGPGRRVGRRRGARDSTASRSATTASSAPRIPITCAPRSRW